jgi:3-phenylpropionate/trans-cinnamate dioxygenase ferredoxin reductase component
MPEHIAIVGGGHAGATLALHLRELGFKGRLTIFGAEPHPPYQRPPLSKKYLSGEWPAERLYLRGEETWTALNVAIRCNAPVDAIDLANRTLSIGDESISWDKLALTTGAASRPMPPPLAGRRGVYDLRSLGDVDAIRRAFRHGARMAIIGGGFIGLETAAVATRHGLEVTVIERAERIMERAVGPATSAYFRQLQAREGVRVLETSEVAHVDERVEFISLTLQDGSALPVDLVLVGIGVAPATELAERAGLATDNGVVVDKFGRTSAEGVWAAGDCAAFPLDDRRLRLESVQNAVDHAKAVAADMLGLGKPYQPVPWFWSDQYETKLQIAGLFHGYTSVVSRQGGNGESHWYFKGERFIAVEAINTPAAFMTGRKLLEGGIDLSPASMAHESFDPRSRLG